VASSNANSVSNNNSRPATTRRTGTESTDAKSDEVEEEAGQTGADAPVLAQKRASEPVTVENERQQQRPPEGNFSIDGPARVGQAKTETPAAVQPSPSLAREDDRDAQRETTAKAKAQDRLEDRPGYAGAAKPKDNEDSELAADRASGVMGKSAPMTAARRGRRSEEVRRDKEVARGGGEPKASSATRRVGGRTFQRQGDAWVDTAYSSTSATTNVARGSEQYRALVADEPELRQIAEQLSGEVIVVWKGRAYRIR
jgi:hypothetical protein